MTPSNRSAPAVSAHVPSSATRDGAYIHGLYVDGARWDVQQGTLEDAYMKELYPKLPVVLIKATPADKAPRKKTTVSLTVPTIPDLATRGRKKRTAQRMLG